MFQAVGDCCFATKKNKNMKKAGAQFLSGQRFFFERIQLFKINLSDFKMFSVGFSWSQTIPSHSMVAVGVCVCAGDVGAIY